MDLTAIGTRLLEERKRLEFSQASFARLLGISREGLRKIEGGESEFKVRILANAAEVGVDTQYVISGIRSVNVKDVESQIGIEKQVIRGPVSGVGFAQTGAKVQITQNNITTERHITKTVAKTDPGHTHISVDQRAALHKLVDEIVEKEKDVRKSPRTYRAVWSALNRHCKVNSYLLIAAEDFERAQKYLKMWLGRLNSSKTAVSLGGDGWRKKKYSQIKIHTKSQENDEAVKNYIARNFQGATSLTELSNAELERVSKYVSGRTKRRR